MRVQSLFIYPVKSLSGIEVSSLELDEFGPAGDRRWMLVNDQGQFITQRQEPLLAKVVTRLGPEGVEIDIPGQGDITVWRDTVKAVTGPEEADEAISRYIGRSLRFVHMPDDSFRRVDPVRVPENRRVGFADGFPLLITNQASLDELNSRLDNAVEMRRFRPNVVISGAEAWSEDRWQSVRVGETRFTISKPCSRCVMTTVDPDTGLKDTDAEPLRTLSRYRKTVDGVIFGQNAVHQGYGRLSVGDAVEISQQES
jgi:uncharacterized protein YcbX